MGCFFRTIPWRRVSLDHSRVRVFRRSDADCSPLVRHVWYAWLASLFLRGCRFVCPVWVVDVFVPCRSFLPLTTSLSTCT
eukprot:scaffold1053_cov332-Pavlova_lutheri.AAC.5